MIGDQRRLDWDKRHADGDFEGTGPNPTLVQGTSELPRGIALELACGSGTNAVWLASQGWHVTAVDWSPVALANGRAKAEAAGVSIDWLERNLLQWSPPGRSFDLVVLVYLHLPRGEREPVYRAAAAAVAPGGRLLVVAHHPQQGIEGQPGPDPDRLFTAQEIAADIAVAEPALIVERAETIRQVPLPGRGPIDSLLILRRPISQESAK
jgi:SAM-dependent methyltransferase